MDFDPAKYGPEVARVLALDGNGNRLLPLTCGPCSSPEAHQILKTWEPARLFPSSDDAAYWFRKAHTHPIYSQLSPLAAQILVRHRRAEFRVSQWDPFAFLSFCDRARRQPGSHQEQAALEIQRAEWQLLFDYCARIAQ